MLFVLGMAVFFLSLSAIHYYLDKRRKMKRVTLTSTLLIKGKREALVFYNTQDINTSLALARDAMHNNGELSHFHRIRVKCMCEEGALIPLPNGEQMNAPGSGTIIQFLDPS